MQHDAPLLAVALLFLTNIGDALLAAGAMRAFAGGEPIFDNFKNVLIFVGFAIASPLVVSFVDAGVMVVTGWADDYWLIWYTRFCSNAPTKRSPNILAWNSERTMPSPCSPECEPL